MDSKASDAAVAADGCVSGCASPDAAVTPPMSYPPAAVWIGSGGSGTSASGAQLNMSIGPRYGAGLVTTPGGASFSPGFLGTDME